MNYPQSEAAAGSLHAIANSLTGNCDALGEYNIASCLKGICLAIEELSEATEYAAVIQAHIAVHNSDFLTKTQKETATKALLRISTLQER